MTRQEQFQEGKSIWFEYVRINGYSFNPTKEGIKKLSILLDLNTDYITKMINNYLEA